MSSSTIHSISVALATCNGGKYLKMQIDSLLGQELAPEEIIVCDDASTDDTLDILSHYEDQGLVSVYKNEQRIGILRNFKKAVSLCKQNNYIAFCDQDDYWEPRKIKETADLLKSIDDERTPALVFADLRLVDDQMKELYPSFWQVLNIVPQKEDLRSELFGNFVTGCTIIMNPAMRAEFLNMPEENIMMHDAWLALIAFSFGKYQFSSDQLVRYRQHGGNVTFETNQKESVFSKISQNLSQIRNNHKYLQEEIAMAKAFLREYQTRLSSQQLNVIQKFIALEQGSYLRKKMASISSRAYRLKMKL